MKCPNCSKEIRDGAAFCGFCGKPVAQPAKTASAVPPPGPAQRQTPPRQSAPPPRAPQPPAPPRQSAQKPPKKKRTGLIVTLCILAFLLVGAGVCGLLIYQGVIDADIDSDSVFAFLRPADDDRDADDDEEDDRRSRGKDDEDEDDGRRSRDKDGEDEDDGRRDRDEDGEDEDDGRRSRDEDDEDGEDDGRRESASGKTDGKASAGASAEDADGEESDRPLLSSYHSDIAVCVVDPMGLWPDTKSKPFEGAAERIDEMERLYWSTPLSLTVVTMDDTGGDIAAFTDNYVQNFRRQYISATDESAYADVDDLVVITFDTLRLSCYMARYTDVARPYDLNGIEQRVGSCISRGDYESAVLNLLRTATEPEPASSEYLLPASDTAYLTRDDLLGLTWEECCFARNEIYARHGRIFSTPAIRAYFEGKSWYSGTIAGPAFDANASNYLSDVERSNVNFIAEYERMTWGGSFY